MQAKYGNNSELTDFNRSSAISFIPKYLRNGIVIEEFVEKVKATREGFKEMSENKIKAQYLKKICDLPLYGAAVVNCAARSSKGNFGKSWLCLTRKGVGISFPYSKDYEIFMNYENIHDWRQEKDSFEIATGSLMKPEKFLFVGNEVINVVDIFENYKDAFEKSTKR